MIANIRFLEGENKKMELTALIMDNRSKKAKQFSLPVAPEYIASEFGYDVGDVSITIQSIEELPDLDCERLNLDLANELAEKLEYVDEDIVLSFIESNSSVPKDLLNAEFRYWSFDKLFF